MKSIIDQDPVPVVYLVLERGINLLWVDNPNHLQAVPGKSETYAIR